MKYRHDAWKALSKFQEAGLIKSIGVSNYLVKHLEDLKTVNNVVPSLNQVEWHPKLREVELHEYCKKNNIVLQAYSSLGSSFNSTLRNDPIIKNIAQRIGKSPSQVLLRWATQNDVAIIPKATSRKHLDENIDLDFTLSDEDVKTLDGFEQSQRVFWNPHDVI